MKKHSLARKIIVSAIFFIVLVVVAPLIILYSLGYRFDKDNEVFIHSGSIVLKTTPFNVEIKINGQIMPQKSIDLINRSYNINGLNPGSYEVEVNSPGFNTWKKQVEVHSGIATEFWNVVLIPQELERKTLIEDNLLKYAFSPDKKKIGYFTEQGGFLTLFVQEGDQNSFVYKESLNQKYVPSAGELKWSPDNQWLLFSLKKNNKEVIYLTYSSSDNPNYTDVIPVGDLLDNTIASLNNDQNTDTAAQKNKKAEVGEINYIWDDQNNIYYSSEGVIYVEPVDTIFNWWTDTSKGTIPLPNNNQNNQPNQKKTGKTDKTLILTGDYQPVKITNKINGFTFCASLICGVDASERKLNLISKKGDLQTQIPLPDNYNATNKYQVFAYSDQLAAILDENGNLFLWDDIQNKKENSEGVKFIFSAVKEAYFSNDGKKLLFATDKEAYVYFVREWEVQPKHSLGDLELVWQQADELEKVQWYLDYQNIFVINKGEIKLVELDDRSGKNITVFAQAQNIGNASYDTRERKLWFTEGEDKGIDKLQEIAYPITSGIFSGLINGGGNN